MQGRSTRLPRKLPVILGRVLLRWFFTKADLVLFVYRFVLFLFLSVSEEMRLTIGIYTEACLYVCFIKWENNII